MRRRRVQCREGARLCSSACSVRGTPTCATLTTPATRAVPTDTRTPRYSPCPSSDRHHRNSTPTNVDKNTYVRRAVDLLFCLSNYIVTLHYKFVCFSYCYRFSVTDCMTTNWVNISSSTNSVASNAINWRTSVRIVGLRSRLWTPRHANWLTYADQSTDIMI